MEKNSTAKESFWRHLANQMGLRVLFDYMIPAESNAFWHSLGGLLGIAMAMQFLTGFLLLFKYIPDAGLAYSIVSSMLQSPTWSLIVSFHYWDAFLIFALLILHLMRVFLNAAYRNGKKGLWFVGIALACLTFVAYTTGEALHWDEVGFAVPWHISEFLQAINLADFFNYSFATLLSIPDATVKLVQLYSWHIAIIPVLMVGLVMFHLILVKEKGVSPPFWKKPSGRTVHFTKQIALYFKWSFLILGFVLFLAAFVPRQAGIPPQLLPESPLYGAEHGPGGLGAKPTFPISWTHGMNVFVGEHAGINPDIWGTVIGMTLMLGSLLLIPFVDRGEVEPTSLTETFSLRKRGWAFLFIALFWTVFLVGVVQNMIAGAG